MQRGIFHCIAAACVLLPGLAGSAGEAMTGDADVVTYAAPRGATLSTDYEVRVNGRRVDVYSAPVWTPPFPQIPSFGGPYSFAYFDLGGTADVTISTKKPLDKVRILPDSRRIKGKVKDGTLTFTLKEPCQLSIEPDAKNGPLILFANPLETDAPKAGDPGVRYFGPGIHEAGEILLHDNETLYIAGGAIVRGGVKAMGNNIRITGRGIIDGGKWPRLGGPTDNPICGMDCKGLRIDGIILKDSWAWTCVLKGCSDVSIDNLKIVSARCENNDGIDLCNCRDVDIRNCFMRTDDDCIAPKGIDTGTERTVENVLVTKCVLWTDRAHVWRVGCECRAAVMRNMVFKDIDVLHFTGYFPWMISVQPAEDMLAENLLWEDIRVNGEGRERLIEIMTEPTPCALKQTPGLVRNCVFRNIRVTGDSNGHQGMVSVRGSNSERTVEGITFDNVVRYGQKLKKDSPEVEINAFTKDISFK